MKVFYLAVVFLPPVLALSPVVHLDDNIVTGIRVGSLDKFLGIPFAEAPRFELPIPIRSYRKNLNASAYGPSCPQQIIPGGSPLPAPTSSSEDCLSLNVYTPTGKTRSQKLLPVAVYIFGGAFQIGSSEINDPIVTRVSEQSITLDLPIIQVSMNYRISAYGFLASKEVDREKSGNIGLFDQRVALRWVQKYIRAFGGDPDKVVIYGSSAGATSVTLQMLAFGGNTENLFRGVLMQSGGPVSAGPLENGQNYYDALVQDTECSSSHNTLKCLKGVPFDTLATAIGNSPNIMSYRSSVPWRPLVDGVFLQENPYNQVKTAQVPKIPILSGNCDDEGTLFSLAQTNLTTENNFRDFVKTVWLPTASDQALAPLWTNYTADPSQGSPFHTGDANQIYPQYKRVAAFQGDILFQGARRHLLKNRSGKQKIYSYLSKKLKSTPVIGSHHGTEQISNILDEYIVRFVYNLDPNPGLSGTIWPEYTSASPNLLTFDDISQLPYVTQDTYRAALIDCVTNLFFKNPW